MTAPASHDPLVARHRCHRLRRRAARAASAGRRPPRALPGRATRSGCRAAPGRTAWRWCPATCCAPETLAAAMAGVDVAYYLVHSMADGRGFDERDLGRGAGLRPCRGARPACSASSISAASGDPAADLSQHLRSRQETGEALREAGVPVTEFRAAVIVGSGSLSFEMIRYLTERLPVMICPHWVLHARAAHRRRDVLDYLVAALDVPESAGRDRRDRRRRRADLRRHDDRLRRRARPAPAAAPVPVLTPRLSSYWVHLVTPIPAHDRAAAHRGPAQRGGGARRRGARALPGDPAARTTRRRCAPRWRSLERRRGRDDAGATRWSTQRGRRAARALTTQEGMIIERRQRGRRGDAGRGVRAFMRAWAAQRAGSADWAWRLRGAARPARRRRGHAPRPARPARPAPRRRAGLLAGRGGGARPRCCACAPR